MTTFLLDPGHGFDTPGKRSPFVPPGVEEWAFNRDIARRICAIGASTCLNIVVLVPEAKSVPLADRVRRALGYSDPIYVSIHANAAAGGDDDWVDSVHGSTVFVHPRSSQDALSLAYFLAAEISTLGSFRDRGVRESDLYVLRKTPMPAVLTECGFMTHSAEATKLASNYWRHQIALAHVQAFEQFLRER